MAEETNDVNTEVDSSTTSAAESVVPANDGVNEQEVTPTPEKAEAQTEKGFEETIKEAFDKSISSVDTDKTEPEKAKVETADKLADGETPAKGGEQKPDANAKTEGEDANKETGKEKGDEKGPVPYDRFAEVNSAKVEAEKLIEQNKPVIEAQQSIINHCNQNNITPERFAYWMDIAAKFETNPIQAMEALKPALGHLQGFTGDSLPPNLQKAVEDGDITADYAKQLAAAQKNQQFSQERMTTTQQQMAEQQQIQSQQALAHSMRSGLETWITTRRGNDPDFKPKAEGAPDGKYELFLSKLDSDSKAQKVASVQDLLKVAEQSYETINSFVKSVMPKAAATTSAAVRSSQSNNVEPSAPKTIDEAMAAAAAKHGMVVAT